MKKIGVLILFGIISAIFSAGSVFAAVGDLIATVTLPGGGSCSVSGTFDGTYYMTMRTSACSGTVIGVYDPPAGSGAATLISNKSVINGSGSAVTISGLAWDPGRGKLWGAHSGRVYLIDVGDKTVSGTALATLEFEPAVGGISLIDGLGYDSSDDTVWYSPDVNLNVYKYSPTGTLLATVAPQNAAGVTDGKVSGVVVGQGDILYIGRDGDAEIRRILKNGTFVSTFATTAGRVEALTCDPVTYSTEAVLAKDAFGALYEAFEVESGTCPLPQDIVPIPEFTLIGTLAVLAGAGAYSLRRRRK